MHSNVKQANRIKIETVIGNLQKRNMKGYYCENRQEAQEKILSMIQANDVVSWGGSVTLEDINVKRYLTNVIDTVRVSDHRQGYIERVKSLAADVYLTGVNAITMDGKLVNIDGIGNRVAAICFGPRKVIAVAGVNKIAEDESSALARVRMEACTANAVRLGRKTPCAMTGQCGDCMIPGQTICCNTVVTRFCEEANRIHVILVNEELGY